jgi:hypothetical protein
MSKRIPFSPELVKVINSFCDLDELTVRAQLMDELEGFFLEADDVDDHRAREYARALRLLREDLELFIETTQTKEGDD